MFFYKKKFYKTMGLKSSNSYENHEAQFPKFSVFIGQQSIFRRYCIQNVKDGSQIQMYIIYNESLSNFSQFISVKVKKNLGKSENQFREKLRKLRLRQNDSFLIEKNVCLNWSIYNLCQKSWNTFIISAAHLEVSLSPPQSNIVILLYTVFRGTEKAAILADLSRANKHLIQHCFFGGGRKGISIVRHG